MSPRTYELLAEGVAIFHFAFVAFVFLGALLILRWRWVALLHLPAVAWVIYVELSGAICPLTPMENSLLKQAGLRDYQGGFVEHYIIPVLYPAGLTEDIQYRLALGLLLLTLRCYEVVAVRSIWQRRRRRILSATSRTASRPDAPAVAASDNSPHLLATPMAGHQVHLPIRR